MITLEEMIVTMKVHEEKLKDCSVKREEKAFYAKIFGKSKEDSYILHSSGRSYGRGHIKG